MKAADELEARVAACCFLLELLDRVPEVVVFFKDTSGRYVYVNDTLARRLGKKSKEELLGRTTCEVFPPPLGNRYLEQDLAVCRNGAPLVDLLELHIYPDRSQDWCLTTKVPMRNASGVIIGLAGVSRDVRTPEVGAADLADLASALALLRQRTDRPPSVAELAADAQLSTYQLRRRVQALFGLTPAQLITKTRIDAACRMLREGREPVAQVARDCGYCDQSAFTRQFRALVGLPPAAYRERHTVRL